MKHKSLSQVSKKPGDSQFLSGLMEVKEQFLSCGRFKVGNGSQTRFWEDLWIGSETLMKRFPSLYNITRRKNDIIANVLSTIPLNVSFRRALIGDRLRKWIFLVTEVVTYSLNDQNDTFVWLLNKTKQFTVSSMYNNIMRNEGLPTSCTSWKLKIPLKIKVFLCYLKQGIILTKDNLTKRRWQGSTKCCFCSANETI